MSIVLLLLLYVLIDSYVLHRRIKKIEERILTKWDIAKVVFQIIAALGAIIGLVFGILQYFKSG